MENGKEMGLLWFNQDGQCHLHVCFQYCCSFSGSPHKGQHKPHVHNMNDTEQYQGYLSNETFDAKALIDLFNLAHGFTDAVIPTSASNFITEEVPKVTSGKFDLTYEHIKDVIFNTGGLAACVVVGLLYVVIFPVIGVCCCACWVCHGKKRRHSFEVHPKQCTRRIVEVLLFLFIMLTIAGIVCLSFSNDYLAAGLDEVGPTARDAMADIDTFIDRTAEGVHKISLALLNEFNNTKLAVLEDLDDIGTSISEELQAFLKDQAGLQTILDNVHLLQNGAISIEANLAEVNGNLTTMVVKTDSLKTGVQMVKTFFSDARDQCVAQACTDGLASMQTAVDDLADTVNGIDSSQFKPPELNQTLEDVKIALQKNFTSIVLENLDTVPEMVNNMSAGSMGDIKTAIMAVDIQKQMEPFLENLNVTLLMFKEMRKEMNFKATITNYSSYAADYSLYVWIGGAVLVFIPCLIITSQLCGLLCGVSASDSRRPSSRAGGNCLLCATVGIFLSSWFLMFMTTILFCIGAPLVRFLCETDYPTMKKFEQMAADQDWFSLQEAIPDDVPLPRNLSITEIMQKCDEGQSMFDALRLDEEVAKFLHTYEQGFDMDSQIEDLAQNVDLSQFGGLYGTVESKLSGIINVTGQFDVQSVTAQLDQMDSTLGGINFTDMADQLVSAALQLPPTEHLAAAGLNQTADQLRGPVNSDVNTLTSTKSDIVLLLDAVNSSIAAIPSQINATLVSVLELQNYIESNGQTIISEASKGTADKLLSKIDAFPEKITSESRYHLQCKPLMNIYHSLIDKGLCEFLVNPVNGMWFSLGLIVISLTFTVTCMIHLTKRYKRESDSSGELGGHRLSNETVSMHMINSKKWAIKSRNRVGPRDM